MKFKPHRCYRPLYALLPLLLVGTAAADESSAARRAEALLMPGAYIEHVKYLADDKLGGRFPGTDGVELAAEYIAERLRAAGCQPAGEDGTYFQSFKVGRLKKVVDADAKLEVSGIAAHWQVRKNWIPFPFSKTEDVEGPLAFAGYGIEASEFEYADYADFDADGKVLLIFRYEPRSDDPEAEFGGKEASKHSLFRTKARVAADHGAKALLVVDPPLRESEPAALYPFRITNTDQTYELPLVHITRPVAEAMLRAAKMPDLAALQKSLDTERKPLSVDMQGLTVRLQTGLQRVKTRNVLGLLEGDGSTDEVVVLGAHYDHIGVQADMGAPDGAGEIHNGADDNATGTAALLELARVFGPGPRPRRNLLFIAFGAEEEGLIGSKYFVKNPTVELKRIKAMVNFDMIGRLAQSKFEVYGVASGEEFKPLVDRVAAEFGLEYKSGGDFFGASDHFSFYKKDIPALFVFTGVHQEYHLPGDDWELIDANGATTLLRMFYRVVTEIGNMEGGPTFVKEPAKPEAPKADAAETGEAASRPAEDGERPARRRPKVRLGVIPDFADSGPGMRVDTAIEGRAAAKAGLKDGDRVVQIGDQKIKDIYEYMQALQGLLPGAVVDVVVERDGQTLTLKIALEGNEKPKRTED